MEIVTKIAPIILALIMLGLGLGLKIDDFTRILKTPKDFFVGFFSQLIILPLVAYLLIIILKVPPEIAIGMKFIRSISIISVIKTCSPPKNLSATAAAVKLEMAIGVTAFIEKCLSKAS